MTAMSAALDGDQAELEALRKQAQAADEQLMKHALAIAPEVEALFPRLFEGGVPQWDWDNIMPLADLEALPEHMLSADRLRSVDKHLRERDLQWTTAREAALQVARSGRVGQAAFMLQATLTEVMNVSGHEERGDWPEPDAEQWFATLKRLQKPLADYFAERTAAACNQKDWVHACDAILWWLDVEPEAGKFWNDAVARTCVREMDRIRAGVANAKKSAEKSKSRDPSGVVWAALLEWRFSPRWW